MSCAEKRRLTFEYEAATTELEKTVRQLQRDIGTSTKNEYECLQRMSNKARATSERARLAFEQHVAEHKC